MSPIFVGNRRIYGPESSDPSGLVANDEGSIVYNTTDDKLKAWDGSAWNALGGISSPEDTGPGGGYSVSQGADNTAGDLTGTTTTYYTDSWIASQGTSQGPLVYTPGQNNNQFGFHTGHNGNSTQWPFHFAMEVSTSIAGAVVDEINWLKHVNAVGNIDVWGSNNAITASNFNDTSNYSYLGRIHAGGSGSASDGTVINEHFNSLKFGYKWVMIECQDTAGPGNSKGELPYPEVGALSGWAMYGIKFRCSGTNTYSTLGNHTSGGTLSNGNLTYSMGAGGFRTESIANVSKGKWYWEATANSGTTNGTVGGRVGVCNPMNVTNPEAVRLQIFWHSTSGLIRSVKSPSYGGSAVFTTLSTGSNYGDGDIIGVALDMDNDIVKFYKNGALAYTYDFSSDATGNKMEFAAHCWNGSSGTPSWTYNFGASSFSYSVPTGYNAGLWT